MLQLELANYLVILLYLMCVVLVFCCYLNLFKWLKLYLPFYRSGERSKVNTNITFPLRYGQC